MSLFQNIYAQTFPYLVDQTPEFDVSNLTQGFNGEESPAVVAHNNFIPFAPQGKAAPADDDPNTAPDLSAQIAQLGDIGQASKAGQRYQEPPPQSAPTAQPDFGNAHPYGDTDTSSNPVDPVTGANVARFTPPEATPAVPMDKTMVPIVLSKNAQKIANQPPPFQPDPNASAAQNKLAQLQYEAENPVDKDQGFKGRLREVLSNFLYGLGQTPPGANVKQALLLGGIGAGAGAFNRTWNERRQAEQELPEAMRNVQFQTDQAYKNAQTGYLQARPGIAEAANQTKVNIAAAGNQTKLSVAQLRAKSVLGNIKARADVKAGDAKPQVNEKGQLELVYLHADSQGRHRPSELLKGDDGQPITVPGEEGVEWEDPQTGAKTLLKARQASQADSVIAAGNATRQQGADTTNAANERQINEFNARLKNDWQERNTKAENDWHNRNANRMIEIAKAGAGANPDTQGIYQQMLGAKDRMQQLVDAGAFDSKAFLEAQKEFWNSNKMFQDAISKQANGQQVVKAMQNALEGKPQAEPEPKYIKYTPIQSAQVGGGTATGKGHYVGQVFASPESLQQYFPGKSATEIKAIVEAQGGRFR